MSVSVTVSGKFSRRRVPAPRDSFLLRACSTTLLHSGVDLSNRSQHDPLVCSPAAKIKQWLAFARCPIRVAQGLPNVLWPITFRRREAQRAGRQTVEYLGKDGATVSEWCHFEPMEEVPALHSHRTVNQARCEDWHLKCRRIGLPVGRQCPIHQYTATRREMPRNHRSGPAGDAIDRSR